MRYNPIRPPQPRDFMHDAGSDRVEASVMLPPSGHVALCHVIVSPAMVSVPVLAGVQRATICIPLTGDRIMAVDACPGLAVNVNPLAVMVNFT